MSKELVIALLGGVTGMLSAILATVQAIRVARMKASSEIALERLRTETNAALEKMKLESDRRRRVFEIASQEAQPLEGILGEVWQNVQEIKDHVAFMIYRGLYKEKERLEALERIAQVLTARYAEVGSKVPEEARRAWHEIKNVLNILLLSLAAKAKGAYGDKLEWRAVRQKLRKTRLVLTEQQIAIQLIRQGLRDSIINKIGEMV